MAADLREMQENQWVSEIRIDKFRFINLYIQSLISENTNPIFLAFEVS